MLLEAGAKLRKLIKVKAPSELSKEFFFESQILVKIKEEIFQVCIVNQILSINIFNFIYFEIPIQSKFVLFIN